MVRPFLPPVRLAVGFGLEGARPLVRDFTPRRTRSRSWTGARVLRSGFPTPAPRHPKAPFCRPWASGTRRTQMKMSEARYASDIRRPKGRPDLL